MVRDAISRHEIDAPRAWQNRYLMCMPYDQEINRVLEVNSNKRTNSTQFKGKNRDKS